MTKRKIKSIFSFVYNYQNMVDMEEIGISLISSVLRENGFDSSVYMQHDLKFDYEMILNENPDIIGFVVYDITRLSVYEIISKVKKILPNCLILVGGATPTFLGKEMMEENIHIDYAIKGEGEYSTLELFQALSENKPVDNIKGLFFRKGNDVIENADRPLIECLDELPFNKHEMVIKNNLQIANVYFSRGCRANCNFCATQKFWKGWRGCSIEKTIDEIEFLSKEKGIRCFNFIDSAIEDPDFSMNRITEIANLILMKNLKIAFYCYTRAEISRIAKDSDLEILKKAGLCTVFIGFESFCDDDLKYYGKRARVKDNKNTMRLFNKHDIVVSSGIINFNPKSTIESLKTNLHYYSKYDITNKFFTKLVVFKGTRAYEQLCKDNMIKEDNEKNININYIFYDPLVGKLSSQIDKFNELYGEKLDYFDYACEHIFSIMSFYKRFAQIDLNTELDSIIDTFLGNHKALNHEYSQMLYNTLLSILDNFNEKWTQKKFNANFIKLFPEIDFMNLRKKMMLNEKIFIKKIVKSFPELKSFYTNRGYRQ